MIIKYYTHPIDHFVIENIYDKTDLSKIWREIDFLTDPNKLLGPESTMPATDSRGQVLKSSRSVFLNEVYKNENFSDILSLKNKIYENFDFQEIVKQNKLLELVFKSLNYSSSLLSYYEDSDEYKFHTDMSIVTVTNYFFREPKNFTGGDLYLCDNNYKIEIKNNMAVIFLGKTPHCAEKISMKDKTQFNGLGRYCVSHFLWNVPQR